VSAAKFWGVRPSPWPAVALAKAAGVGEGVPPPSRTSHRKFRRRETQRPTRGTRMLPNPRRAPRRTHYIHSTFLSSFDIRISSFDSFVSKRESAGRIFTLPARFSLGDSNCLWPYFIPTATQPWVQLLRMRALLSWTRSDPYSSTKRTGVIRAATTPNSAGDVGFEVLGRAGVIGVLVLARVIIIHRLYSECVVVSAEIGVNSSRPFPLGAHSACVRTDGTTPSKVTDSAG